MARVWGFTFYKVFYIFLFGLDNCLGREAWQAALSLLYRRGDQSSHRQVGRCLDENICHWLTMGTVSTDLVSLPLGAPTSFQILVTFLFGLSSFSYGSETKQSPNHGERATFGKEGRTVLSVWAMLSVRCL